MTSSNGTTASWPPGMDGWANGWVGGVMNALDSDLFIASDVSVVLHNLLFIPSFLTISRPCGFHRVCVCSFFFHHPPPLM